MHPLIISAPFGNYLRWPGVTSTLGTHTYARRARLHNRLWRVLTTVRYWPRTESWVNKMGLPSPGLGADELRNADYRNSILSIHGFNKTEWGILAEEAAVKKPLAVELNASCPNVTDGADSQAGLYRAAETLSNKGMTVIVKLPPLRWMALGVPLYERGIHTFHLCNTIPTPGGGLSGKPLKQYSLWAIDEFRQKWGEDVTLIGGGGITSLEDVMDYMRAGANHVAIASMLFNPFNWRKVPVFRNYLDENYLKSIITRTGHAAYTAKDNSPAGKSTA